MVIRFWLVTTYNGYLRGRGVGGEGRERGKGVGLVKSKNHKVNRSIEKVTRDEFFFIFLLKHTFGNRSFQQISFLQLINRLYCEDTIIGFATYSNNLIYTDFVPA